MPKKPAILKPKSTKKIGETTAQKMKQKLSKLKQKKNNDEDIESNDSADEKIRPSEDPFLVGMVDDEAQKETAEEKRLRLTKKIINDYAAEEKTDFFATLVSKSTAEQEIIQADDN